MIQPNPTRIANRIGRIALATVLAGVLAALTNVPGEVRSGSFPSLTDPIGIYATIVVEVWTHTIFASLLVPLVMGSLWLLSRRFSRVRVWQAILVVTTALAAGMSSDHWGEPLAFAASTADLLAFAGAMLAAVAVVELLFAWDIASQASLEGFITASGGTIAVVVALVLVVATISTGALAVADTAGVSLAADNDERGSLTADELESEYGHYLDVESGDELTCEPAPVVHDGVPTAAETHRNDLSAFEVDAKIQDSIGDTDLVYEFHYTGDGMIQSQRSERVDNSEVLVDGDWDKSINDDSYEMVAIDGTTAYHHGDSINGTYVEFDVVNDDGEVIRYTGTLCDKNLE